MGEAGAEGMGVRARVFACVHVCVRACTCGCVRAGWKMEQRGSTLGRSDGCRIRATCNMTTQHGRAAEVRGAAEGDRGMGGRGGGRSGREGFQGGSVAIQVFRSDVPLHK